MRQLTDALPLPRPIAKPANELLMTVIYAARTLSGTAQMMLREYDLTEAQFNLLILLDHQFPEGTSQVELSRCLVVNKANVTGLIDRMVRDDLVRREANPQDRRAHVIRMTPEGKRRLHAATQAYDKVLAAIDQALSPDELRTQIQALLRLAKIAKNITAPTS